MTAKQFFTKIWVHIKEVFWAFLHALTFGLVQFWNDTADERASFKKNIWQRFKDNLKQKK